MKPKPPKKQWLTYEEAGAWLSVHPETVKRWKAAGLVEFRQVFPGVQGSPVRVSRKSLRRLRMPKESRK